VRDFGRLAAKHESFQLDGQHGGHRLYLHAALRNGLELALVAEVGVGAVEHLYSAKVAQGCFQRRRAGHLELQVLNGVSLD